MPSATDTIGDDDGQSWAHASGWAQLMGERRNVSCVLLGLSNPVSLGQLLPVLSDALTEAGYPWEVIAVDASGDARVAEVLTSWGALPGIRRLAMPVGTSVANLLTAGLQSARGDAVLLMSERCFREVGMIPPMVSNWCDGMEVVRSGFGDFDRTTSGQHDGRAQAEAQGLAGLADELILLDRRAVGLLLNDR